MSDDPFAPFRSRRARVVTLTLGAVAVLVFAAVAVGLYVSSGRPDALLLVVFGLAVAAVCWRYASISAIPDREGILVRNLLLTRRVAWSKVERVDYGGGAPWATLVLDDGDALAIMAIQRADGPSAQAEASRLAALVQALG
ncbi:MAG: PH domain-containing protein [Dermatophilaceae bacterium]